LALGSDPFLDTKSPKVDSLDSFVLMGSFFDDAYDSTDPNMQHLEPTMCVYQPSSSYMPASEASGESELRGAAQKLDTSHPALLHQIAVQFKTKQGLQEFLEAGLNNVSSFDNIEDFIESLEQSGPALSLEGIDWVQGYEIGGRPSTEIYITN
jgi:hypothetical protein